MNDSGNATAEFDLYHSTVLAPKCDLAASERLFSVTGRLVNQRRSRLLPERVESLVFKK